MDNWKCKRKGNARIYTHPNLTRAIVENHLGIYFNGVLFESIESAKKTATQTNPVLRNNNNNEDCLCSKKV